MVNVENMKNGVKSITRRIEVHPNNARPLKEFYIGAKKTEKLRARYVAIIKHYDDKYLELLGGS